MLPTPPYDTHVKKPYSHRSLPPMQSYGNTLPSHPYEMTRHDDYVYPVHYNPAVAAVAIPQGAYHSDNIPYTTSMKVAQFPDSSHVYVPATAPVLPPVRAPDPSVGSHREVRSNRAPAVSQPPPKGEKVGGVAAHLDYQMEEMVNFVSEVAQGMYGIFTSKICLADIDMTRSVLSSKTSVHPEFRRYVSQVLTSTRLPSSTILLGLHYLAVRMTILSSRGNYTYGGGDVYSLLTTALLLGSKFLDDNTFQNRSWSDVSNISVKKLNRYETEWLQDINWDLHFDVSDPKGFALWRHRWQTFQNTPFCKNIDSLTDTMKNTSIDKSHQQQQNSFQSVPSSSRYGLLYPDVGNAGHFSEQSTPQWLPHRYDMWKLAQRDSEYSPPSAPETGPNTPDYTISNDFDYGTLPSSYPSVKMPAPLHIVPANAPTHGYPTPQYNRYVNHNHYCGCSYCIAHGERYAINYNFNQTVAG